MSGNFKAILLAAALFSAVPVCHAEEGLTAIPHAQAFSRNAAAFKDTGQNNVTVPGIGNIDAARLSLPVFTVIIAALDGFNPCAFYVLFFLLSLMIHARSRKRMLMMGGVFVFVSGLVYFLFMSAWLNLFLLVGRLFFITAAAGVVALIVSMINIKDFFFFKKGVSLVIPESAKPRLFERMRGLLKSGSAVSLLGGTAVLATAANSYELLCTAGFPMVFTRVLTLRHLPPLENYLYLALYNAVYVLPLAGIVVIFTVTLGAHKLTEWEGRKLKLVSGLMMFCLGMLLLVSPKLLNNALAATLLLVIALTAAAIIIFVTKKLRPEAAG
jgi:hypothetical protein